MDRTPILFFLMTLVCSLPTPVNAVDIHIGSARKIVVNAGSAIDMNCNAIRMSDTSRLNVNGEIKELLDVVLEDSPVITGEGLIAINGLWLNNSDYLLASGLNISFNNDCNTYHACTGEGDTDGDSLSDRLEGTRDRNDDGIYDFLDSATQSYICDINNDNVLDLKDVIFGLRLISDLPAAGVDVDVDINHDGRVGLAEVHCVLNNL